MTRWDPKGSPTIDNLVLLSLPQAKILHEKGKEAFSPEIIEKIESRIRWAKQVCSRYWEHDIGSNEIAFHRTKKPVIAPNDASYAQDSLLSSLSTAAVATSLVTIGFLIAQKSR